MSAGQGGSERLFSGLAISRDSSYKVYLNRYDIIYIDMADVLQKAGTKGLIPFIQTAVTNEIREAYPEAMVGNTFDETLINTVEYTKNKFFMIIPEWDAPVRETPEIQDEYLDFLRMLFKSSGTTDRIFAAAYMTGTFPIKKDGSESAISDFWEFSMLNPGEFQEYIGFTDEEVRTICEKNHLDIEDMRRWYDGYSFDQVDSIYNPYSIMRAVKLRKYKSYWRMSSSADKLEDYINANYDGLFDTVLRLLNGMPVYVDTEGFNNDAASVKNLDDLLTLLIHLGYLAYRESDHTVRIPNEEIRAEFSKAAREVRSIEAVKRLQQSRQLIMDTMAMKADAVAAQIESVHSLVSDPLHYNNEQALRCTIQIAYYAYPDYYLKFEELGGGAGYADIVYLPRRISKFPALVVELKWNKSSEGAVSQIKNKRNPEVLHGYDGEILPVGINYSKNSGPDGHHHTCIIEKYNADQ